MQKSINKKLFVLCVLFLTCATLFAQVKNYVCIVRGKLSPDYDTTSFGNGLENNGFSEYKGYFSDYINSVYGSGFIYIDKDGNNYVITNLHVVSFGNYASIEIEDSEGNKKTYKDLYVSYIDRDADIAILRFKNNENPFKNGLPLAANEPSDGAEVYSAGFPAFGNEPLWQLGKGIITNNHVKSEQLVNKSLSYVIQHSAEIDSGNSGGPLLRKTSNSIGYEVVGVNTWKALYRESTNFAIPVTVVKNVIADSLKNNRNEELLKICKADFSNILNTKKDATELMKYISNEAALLVGEQCFINVCKSKDYAAKGSVQDFYKYCPIDGLKLAIAYDIIEDSKDGKLVENELEWFMEQGVWKIKSPYEVQKTISSKKKTSSKRKGTSIGDITFSITPGVIFNLETGKPHFVCSSELGIFAGYGSIGVYYEAIDNKDKIENKFCFTLGTQVPITISDFFIIPHVKLGFNVIDKYATYDAGIVVNYSVTDYFEPGINISYVNDIKLETINKKEKGGINISGNIGFRF